MVRIRRLLDRWELEWGESDDTPQPPRCARVAAGEGQTAADSSYFKKSYANMCRFLLKTKS